MLDDILVKILAIVIFIVIATITGTAFVMMAAILFGPPPRKKNETDKENDAN